LPDIVIQADGDEIEKMFRGHYLFYSVFSFSARVILGGQVRLRRQGRVYDSCIATTIENE
jgi:hypothetical protein